MADMKSISPSQVIMATCSILLILVSSCTAKGSKFCKATDAGAEMALCVKLVNGAKTWEQALISVVQAIDVEAKRDKPLFDSIPKHLPRQLKPVSKSSILSTCKEAHQNVLDGVQDVLGNIQSGDPMRSIDTELSATLSALSDCTDGLDEFGVDDPEIVKARDTVEKYASISLAISSLKRA